VRPIDVEDDDEDDDDKDAEDDKDEAKLEEGGNEETEETEGHRLPCESTRCRRAISGVSETSASR
jgi:hypothetical protein